MQAMLEAISSEFMEYLPRRRELAGQGSFNRGGFGAFRLWPNRVGSIPRPSPSIRAPSPEVKGVIFCFLFSS